MDNFFFFLVDDAQLFSFVFEKIYFPFKQIIEDTFSIRVMLNKVEVKRMRMRIKALFQYRGMLIG